MHLEAWDYNFDGVLFGFYCSPKNNYGFWLLSFVILLTVNKYGGTIELVPQHLQNLSKIVLLVDEVHCPSFSDDSVTLSGTKSDKKGNTFAIIPILFFLF